MPLLPLFHCQQYYNSTPLLNDSVHCSTRNTIEKLYNSNQNLASHLLYVKLIQRCLKNYETATSIFAIDNKSKSKFTDLACGIKLTNPCKACWFHNNFYFCLLYDDDERKQIYTRAYCSTARRHF